MVRAVAVRLSGHSWNKESTVGLKQGKSRARNKARTSARLEQK